tara:strand:+ start:164 stop:643 length:480 start_codon:yes stop_codon:yes gene_type:complete
MALPLQYFTSGSRIPSTNDDLNEELYIGISMPLRNSEISGSLGYFESTNYTGDAIKENLRNLLNTHKGERIMKSDFGINWNKYLFEQTTEAIRGRLAREIRTSVIRYMPYLTIKKCVVTERAAESDLMLYVYLEVRYKRQDLAVGRVFNLGAAGQSGTY